MKIHWILDMKDVNFILKPKINCEKHVDIFILYGFYRILLSLQSFCTKLCNISVVVMFDILMQRDKSYFSKLIRSLNIFSSLKIY